MGACEWICYRWEARKGKPWVVILSEHMRGGCGGLAMKTNRLLLCLGRETHNGGGDEGLICDRMMLMTQEADRNTRPEKGEGNTSNRVYVYSRTPALGLGPSHPHQRRIPDIANPVDFFYASSRARVGPLFSFPGTPMPCLTIGNGKGDIKTRNYDLPTSNNNNTTFRSEILFARDTTPISSTLLQHDILASC
jgi:hypothetical protein